MKKTLSFVLVLLGLLAFTFTADIAHADGAQFYVVQYDANGANYNIESQPKYPGVDLILSDSAPTYRGHVFLGWATSPTAVQPEYQPEDTFSVDADTTLYAVWMDCMDLGTISEKGTFHISYPIQKRFAYVKFTPSKSGNYVIRSTNKFYDRTSASTRLEYEKNYGSYSNWDWFNIDSDWEQGEFSAIVELEAGKPYYLFYYHVKDVLQLEISNNVYTVSYDTNGASYNIDSQPKYPGVDLILSDSAPTYRGHIFLGWATSPNVIQPEYQPKDTFSVDADTTLYAVWMDCMDLGTISEKGTFHISYPIQKRFAYVKFTPSKSGNYVIRSTNKFYDRTSASTRLEYEKNYGSYSNWDWFNIDSDWEQGEFSAIVELEAGKPYYLFYYHVKDVLQLEISNKVYTVSYDTNGASYNIDSQPKYPGVDLTLTNSAPTYRGHIFLGWATSPTATQPEYQPKDTFSVDADTTLYAVWMDCVDLGTVSEQGSYSISYPVQNRFAYIKFTPAKSGNYVIRSTNQFYTHSMGSTELEYYGSYGFWNSFSLDYGFDQDDFSGLVTLEAGKTYYLFYYHVKDVLELEILFQRSNSSSAETIEQESFAGAAFTSVDIPANIKTIASKAFANCINLREVRISTSSVEIAPDAFSGCENLLIIAPAGSTAQAYANQHGWAFQPLN